MVREDAIKVLLIEDDEDDFLITRDLLSDITGQRFVVDWVSRYEEAEKAICEGKYDVYLVDYRLGNHNGLDLLRLAQERGCDAPMILLTGEKDPDVDVAAMQAGAADYLVKGQIEAPLLERSIRYSLQQARTMQALLDSEERFHSAFDNAAIGMALVGLDGRWLQVNQPLCEIVGYTEDELLARTFQSITHPDDMVAGEALAQEVLDGQRRSYHLEKRYLHKDGRTVWVLLSVSVVRDAESRPLYFIAQMQDITPRKQAEEALHKSEEQLRHVQKLEAVGRLAGGIAHDFNNLLTAITGYSELLLTRLREPELRLEVEEIRKAAQRATSLTRQLLSFSRRQMLQMRVLDMNAVVLDMEKMLRRLIGDDVELVTRLAAKPARVRADRGQIEQVVMNLAVNGRDAMPRGGLLRIETHNVPLTAADLGEAGLKPGDYVALRVSDTGTGMTEQVLSHIFEPFFTTKEPDKGTGLGLATVYGIVKQSGGHLTVDSEPGVGSTFSIYLPLVQEEVEATERRPEPHNGKNLNETVLLVEDQPIVRKLVGQVLRLDGYQVLEAGNGGEAMQVGRQHQGPIHLMVTDVVMPQMSGGELAQRLSSERPDMKVLYVSGYASSESIPHIKPGDDHNFLQKPFTPDDLTRKVREVLEARA